MLSRIFQGSSPSTSRITPIRIDSSISRKMTDSGGPPKKRANGSLLAGRWAVVGRSGGMLLAPSFSHRRRPGTARAPPLFQDSLQRFQPVGFARRLVPAQPADAGKAHGEPRLVPRRTLQSLEGDLKHQALGGLVHDLSHRAEALDGVAADEAIDLDQLLVGE